MRGRRRISHLLMLIILCILIFYAGIYMQLDITKNEITLMISEAVIEHAGKTYLSGLFYDEEDVTSSVDEWIVDFAFQLVPLGNYVSSTEVVATGIEDGDTYEMILSMQNQDENEVDESGKLVTEKEDSQIKETKVNSISMEKLNDFEYLLNNFYTVDSSTSVTEELLNAKKLLKKDMTINQEENGPKILIYHTHSQEAFKDSKKGKTSDTIMGMGEYLAQILNEKYKINTLHHEGVYDLIDGNLDRSKAYQLAETQISKILKENPSIEVVIDLHRDGVRESTHLVTEINGKKTAQIMFFNGMSRSRVNGNIEYLYNPYIEDNLAFSLQMQIEAMERYPGFTRRIYLKSYRYNMHLAPKTLLIEAGAQTNTVAEMKRAMKILAEVLDSVLTK